MRWNVLDSPIGELSIAVDEVGVCAVAFRRVDEADVAGGAGGAGGAGTEVGGVALLDTLAGQLREYFAGELTDFDVPLSVRRGSDFERAVWSEIARIPFGETITYGAIAAAVGDPEAARAVGVACNRNPLPLVVPCHRVVGANGTLVGFGGGLPRKRFLLELEARVTMERAWR